MEGRKRRVVKRGAGKLGRKKRRSLKRGASKKEGEGAPKVKRSKKKHRKAEAAGRLALRREAESKPWCVGWEERERVGEVLSEHGVCVVTDVFSAERCEEWCADVLRCLAQALTVPDPDAYVRNTLAFWRELASFGGRKASAQEKEELRARYPPGSAFYSGDRRHLPAQTREGLFSSGGVSNMRPLWEVRKSERVRQLFELAYTGTMGRPPGPMVVSGDGMNLCSTRPDPLRPQTFRTRTDSSTGEPSDWAHVDKTLQQEKKGEEGSERNHLFSSIQGQAVMADSDASFRATPGSHKLWRELMRVKEEASGKRPSGDWCIVRPHTLEVRRALGIAPDRWQVPIRAPAGSFILWSSALLHSATNAERVIPGTCGHRAVQYVCFTPLRLLTPRNLATRERALLENRWTRHNSRALGSKNAAAAYGSGKDFEAEVLDLMENPHKVHERTGYHPAEDPQARELAVPGRGEEGGDQKGGCCSLKGAGQ